MESAGKYYHICELARDFSLKQNCAIQKKPDPPAYLLINRPGAPQVVICDLLILQFTPFTSSCIINERSSRASEALREISFLPKI